jgi:hypothetical protein
MASSADDNKQINKHITVQRTRLRERTCALADRKSDDDRFAEVALRFPKGSTADGVDGERRLT